MDFSGLIPDGQTGIVALARDSKEEIVKMRLLKDVDPEEFLHGNGDYLDKVFNKAIRIFGLE